MNKILKLKKDFAFIFTLPGAQKHETKDNYFLMTSLLPFMFLYTKNKSEQ